MWLNRVDWVKFYWLLKNVCMWLSDLINLKNGREHDSGLDLFSPESRAKSGIFLSEKKKQQKTGFICECEYFWIFIFLFIYCTGRRNSVCVWERERCSYFHKNDVLCGEQGGKLKDIFSLFHQERF